MQAPENQDDESVLSSLGEVIGTAATLRMIALFGGTFLYVPQSMPDDHVFVRCLGLDAARRLSAHFAGEKLAIPRGEEDFIRMVRIRRVAGLLRGGTSTSDTATLVGVSARMVRHYRAEAEEMGLLPRVFESDAS